VPWRLSAAAPTHGVDCRGARREVLLSTDASFQHLHPAHLPPGTVVGAWCVRSRESCGAYGAVYLASRVSEQDGALFALKVALHPNDPRFPREAELLRRIDHPHVPRLHDHGLWAHPAGPFPFLVMDRVEGVPLEVWARERTRTSREVMRLLAPVASALAATHAVHGVHRDVKGANILVRQGDSWPTLLDFGAGDFLGAPTLTRELLPPGTPYHRSPEALRFHWLNRQVPGAHYKPGPADDIYAMGVTAYCLVTGTCPPPVLPPELLASDPSFRPSEWEPPEKLVTVCPELAALIRQMLSLEPSARGSAEELAQAFEDAAWSAGPEADRFIVLPTSEQDGVASQAKARSGPVPKARKSSMDAPGVTRVPWRWLAMMAGLVAFFVLRSGVHRWHREGLGGEGIGGHPQGVGSKESIPSGLGQFALKACGGTEEPALSDKEIGLTVPKTPLLGQARPPCKRREVEINGGCWKLLAEPAPCTEREYEWRGLCYAPVLDPSPPATSEQ